MWLIVLIHYLLRLIKILTMSKIFVSSRCPVILDNYERFETKSVAAIAPLEGMGSMDSDSKQLEGEKIALLQKWASEKDFIPELPEKDIRLFLQSCYNNLEQTKNTIVSYYKLRVQSPEYFSNRDPSASELLAANANSYAFPLPGKTKEGYSVFMCGYFHTDTSTFASKDMMKRFLMSVDLWLSKMESCPGIIVLIDCKNSTFGHMTATPLDASKKLVTYFQEALPVRLQAVYFINISSAMNFFLSMVQPFLSSRITNLIHKFVRENDDYFDTIPKEILPFEVGGEAGTTQQLNDAMTQDLIDHTQWFLEEDQKIQFLAKKFPKKGNSMEID